MGGLFDDLLRPSHLRWTQFSLLVALSLHGGATVTELATELLVDRTTLTRNLAPLERAGLVASAANSDRRQRVLRLTKLGEHTLARAIPLWEQAQSRLVQRLGKVQWNEPLTGLNEVVSVSS